MFVGINAGSNTFSNSLGARTFDSTTVFSPTVRPHSYL
jgi:hypothetical protein